ncbi:MULTISPECIES: prealbumin-like fold domain-containing protein [Caproicibacterium]|uniref:Prealbumin-like fold domain-containing protein n=1 Tax=Caproicibacterium argilliputei TaxID=3030016 RepID=A0AA97H199_9FIRM|nr:prealbumin-like fold domain-containing protein [Caproicibacterium argilliputei]WOC31425.1 prealbumin-like fold domain-containing protein [Caproicibacterium argilliputei]
MLKNMEKRKNVSTTIRHTLRKAVSSVLAFAVTVSAFTGLAPLSSHAADEGDTGTTQPSQSATSTSSADPHNKGLITNLISKADLKAGVSVSGTTPTTSGASYSWNADNSDWAGAITYNFTIPMDKIQRSYGNKDSAVEADYTYDLDLPPEICTGISNVGGTVNVTATFTNAIQLEGTTTTITTMPIGSVSIVGPTATTKKAILTLGKYKKADSATTLSAIPNYDALLNVYAKQQDGSSQVNDSYRPNCSFQLNYKLEKSAVNVNQQSTVAYYFGGGDNKSRDASYFTLDLQFAEYTPQTPVIDLSGHQVTTTQTVSINGQSTTFTDVSTGEIEWTAVITPNNCSYTDLVYEMPGDYVANSFVFKGNSSQNVTADSSSATVKVTFSNALNLYADSATKQIVLTYRTRPADSDFVQPSHTFGSNTNTKALTSTITAKAGLTFAGGSFPSPEASVDFSQTWLRKKGIYMKSSNQVYWILLFNENARTVKDITIQDELDQQTFTGTVYVSTKPIVADDTAQNVDTLWTLNSPKLSDDKRTMTIDLKDKTGSTTFNNPLYIWYTTKVDTDFFNQENAEEESVTDDPHIGFTLNDKWTGATGAEENTPVTPGISALRKVGVYHADTHTIDWTIYLNEATAQWTYVDLQDVIDSSDETGKSGTRQRLIPLNDVTPIDVGTVDSKTQSDIFKNYIEINEGGQNSTESVATGTIDTTTYHSTAGSTDYYTSTIHITWADSDSATTAKENNESAAKVLPIKSKKTIHYRTIITAGADYTGNGKDGGTEYKNDAKLFVNPGPASPVSTNVTLSATDNTSLKSGTTQVTAVNPVPDPNKGRFVADKFYCTTGTGATKTVSTTDSDQDSSIVDSSIVKDKKGNPLIATYHYEKWDTTKADKSKQIDEDAVTLGSADSPKVETGTVKVTSTMLRAGFTNVLDNGAKYDYVKHTLKLQVTVNQNKQSEMNGYCIKDVLPTGTSYVKDSLSGTLTDSSGTENTINKINDLIIVDASTSSGTVYFTIQNTQNTSVDSKTLTFTFNIEITKDSSQSSSSELAVLALDGDKPLPNFTLKNNTYLYSTKQSASADTKNESPFAQWTELNTNDDSANQSVTVESPIVEEKVLPEDTSHHTVQYQLLVNKIGTAISGTNKIPISVKLPAGMQVIENSVQFQDVAVTSDGSSVDEASMKNANGKYSDSYPVKQLVPGSDYTYSVSGSENGTPGRGTLTISKTGDDFSRPCRILFTAEVGSLVSAGTGQNLITYNYETNINTTPVTLQSVDEASTLATSDRAVIKVQKVDDSGTPLAGALFDILCTDMPMLTGSRFASVATNKNGLAVFRVPAGHTYTIEEYQAPSGYTMDSSSPFTKQKDGTGGVQLTVTTASLGNVYQYYGTEKGFSKDTSSGNVVSVVNKRNNDSSIVLYAQSTPPASSTTSSTDSAASSNTSSVTDSSNASSAASSAASSSTDSTASSESGTKAVFTGALPLRGAGETASSHLSGTALKGAVYGLYKDEACDTLLQQATSDSNGKIEFTKLAWGGDPYYIQEITPPDLFASHKTSTPYKAVLTSENDVTFSEGDLSGESNFLIISYTPKTGTGTVQVTKLGKDTGEAGLGGAVFQLLTKDGAVFQTATSAAGTGLAAFSKLPAGTFILHEVTPPEGYLLTSDVDAVTVKEGEITKQTVTDSPDPASQMGHVTLEMKYDKVTDAQIGKEYNFTVRLQDESGNPVNGKFTYTRSDGKTGSLTFGKGTTSSSTTKKLSLRTATSFASTDSTAGLPMTMKDGKTSTTAILKVPYGYHYTIAAPTISGYTLKSKNNTDSYVSDTTSTATFDYTQTAGSTTSTASGSSSTASGSSGTSNTGSSASKSSNVSGSSSNASGQNASGASGQNASGAGKNGTNGTNGTNGSNANGKNGTNGTSGSSAAKKGETLPKTNVPDTIPFWSAGLAVSLLCTFFVLRWGYKRRKKGE